MLDKNFDTEGMSRVLDKLMIGLGFGDGYIAQGGDIGSFISRILGVTSSACKAVHINLCIGVQGESTDGMTAEEIKGLERVNDFVSKSHCVWRLNICSYARQPWAMRTPANTEHDQLR